MLQIGDTVALQKPDDKYVPVKFGKSYLVIGEKKGLILQFVQLAGVPGYYPAKGFERAHP